MMVIREFADGFKRGFSGRGVPRNQITSTRSCRTQHLGINVMKINCVVSGTPEETSETLCGPQEIPDEALVTLSL